MRGSWSEFSSKWGFDAGASAAREDFAARTRLVRALNVIPELRKCGVSATVYDHIGCHNHCMILLVRNPDGLRGAALEEFAEDPRTPCLNLIDLFPNKKTFEDVFQKVDRACRAAYRRPRRQATSERER